MSQENVDLVRRFYDALDKRDVSAVLAVYSPEVEFDVSHDVWAELTGGGR